MFDVLMKYFQNCIPEVYSEDGFRVSVRERDGERSKEREKIGYGVQKGKKKDRVR